MFKPNQQLVSMTACRNGNGIAKGRNVGRL